MTQYDWGPPEEIRHLVYMPRDEFAKWYEQASPKEQARYNKIYDQWHRDLEQADDHWYHDSEELGGGKR